MQPGAQRLWEPVQSKHAIDRVRLLVTFRDSLTLKQVDRISDKIKNELSTYNYDTVEESYDKAILQITHDLPSVVPAPNIGRNGWVFKIKGDQGNTIEELGYRLSVLGFVTTRYGSWDAMRERLGEVFFPVIKNYIESTDILTIRLEYYDLFKHPFPENPADASDLIVNYDTLIPDDIIKGQDLWHSHCGWFEDLDGFQLLIQRNIDVQKQDQNDVKLTILRALTALELRIPDVSINTERCRQLLDIMHNRAHLTFGATLSEEARKSIGLEMERYQ